MKKTTVCTLLFAAALLAAIAAGRDPDTLGIEARIDYGSGTPDDWARALEAWRALGATHISVNTMRAGLGSPREHIEAIRRFKEAVPAE